MGRRILGPILAGGLAMVTSGCVVRPADQLNRVNAYDYTNQVVKMCTDGQYDLNDRCILSYKTISDLMKTNYVLEKRVFYMPQANAPEGFKKAYRESVRKKYGRDTVTTGGGTAVMYKDGYMITATHVLGFEPPEVEELKWGKDGKKYKLIPIQTFYFVKINGKEYQADVAVKGRTEASMIKVRNLPKNMKFPKIRFGKLADIKAGNLVYIIGDTGGYGIQFKAGKVRKPNAKEFMKFIKRQTSKRLRHFIDGKYFMIDSGARWGDSGCGVYLIRDGRAEFGGLYINIDPEMPAIGGILSADSILKALKPHFKRLRL